MKTKLLFVDDDSSVAAALTVALGGEGFDVLHAFNGHQAVAIYRRIRVDIVLLDLNMPVKNGWDTFERLNSINPLLPIIITASPINPLSRRLAAWPRWWRNRSKSRRSLKPFGPPSPCLLRRG